jgi:signal transduction histidine kinase
LRLVHEITVVANEARSIDEALRYTLASIARFHGWQAGHAYLLADAGDVLVPTNIWYAADDGDYARLRQATSQAQFPIAVQGWVGEVLRHRGPQWIDERSAAKHYVRGRAAGELGVHSAAAFPVYVGSEVRAVLEFFSREPLTRDPRFLEAMHSIGIQLGRVIERNTLEKEVAEVTDAEQRRLGEEIHDGIGQQLGGIGMLASALLEQMKAEGSRHVDRLTALVEAVEDTKRQSRALTTGLMPVEVAADGLLPALADLVEQTRAISSLDCLLQGAHAVRLGDSFVATQLFRIAQEAVHNAVKHAQAKRIVVELEAAEQTTLRVRDDGAGMDVEATRSSGRGIQIMRHRASLIGAAFSIVSAPTRGTEVVCTMRPTDPSHPAAEAEKGIPG